MQFATLIFNGHTKFSIFRYNQMLKQWSFMFSNQHLVNNIVKKEEERPVQTAPCYFKDLTPSSSAAYSSLLITWLSNPPKTIKFQLNHGTSRSHFMEIIWNLWFENPLRSLRKCHTNRVSLTYFILKNYQVVSKYNNMVLIIGSWFRRQDCGLCFRRQNWGLDNLLT